MLDRLIQFARGIAVPPRPESDRACPVCRAADAIKIDPLLAEPGPRPLMFQAFRPMLCMQCYALVLVDSRGDARAADYAELRVFRAAWPLNWRAIDACQQDYQRRQILVIREQGGIKAEGRRQKAEEKKKP